VSPGVASACCHRGGDPVVLFVGAVRTHRVGRLFGPVMLLWFVPLLLAYRRSSRSRMSASLCRRIHCLRLRPSARRFIPMGACVHHRCEALYADMGHSAATISRGCSPWFSPVDAELSWRGVDPAPARRGGNPSTCWPRWAQIPLSCWPRWATVIASQR